MANTPIKIKRSLVTNVPVKLNIGEPAYSYSSNTLFIGTSDSNGSIAIAGFDSFERSKSTYLLSNAAFDHANSGFIQANSAFIHTNAAFDHANSAYQSQNATGQYANAAFIRANNSLDANNGGTVESTVTFLYDIVVGGDVVNKFRTVRVEANVITLNINVSSTSQPTLNAGIEVSRGAQPNVFILWNEVDNKWQFTNDGIGYDDLGGSSASSYANAAFIQANASYIHANSGFIHANSAYESQNATGQYANAAFIHANSGFIKTNAAFDHANASYISQNATGQYANAAFIHANSAFIQTNASYNHANAAYESQNATGQYSNSAFIRANNSLDANNGGTITGNVIIAANLTTQNVYVRSFIDLNTAPSNPVRNEGRLFYDNYEKSIAFYGDSDETIQIGQCFIRVWNNSGSTIDRGKVVRIGSDVSSNGFPGVVLSSADSAQNSESIGFTTTSIANNSYGYVLVSGEIHDINTSLFSPGQELFLSTTPGEYVTTPPAPPNVPIAVGYILTSDVSSGSLLVHIHLMEGKNKTDGAILFGRNGAIDQDATKLYWDYINDRLGIDTNNPQANLHVAGDGLFTGNLSILGNLEISNAQTITTEQLFIGGNTLILNANTVGTPVLNAAIIVNRGSSPNSYILWDETVNEWLAYEGTGEPGHILVATKTANTWAVYDNFEAYEKEFYPIGANLANTINEHAKAGFATANIAENLAIASFKHANSGFIQANSSYDHANAAFNGANNEAGVNLTQNTNIQFAWNHSNSGFIAANSAGVYANGAFIAANTPSDVANSASIYANGAFVLANGVAIAANTPSDVANSAAIYANGAFIHANSAFDFANGAAIAANTPSHIANSAAIYANGAFVAANIADDKAITSGNYANAAFIIANSGFIQANSAFDHANAAFNAANNALDTWVRGQANAAFDQANAAFIHANSAFDLSNGAAIAANTPSYIANSASIYANGAFIAANSSGVYANGAFITANTPSHVANSASIYANGAFETANAATATNVTQNNSIIAAFNHANAAFEQANTGGGGGGGADQYARDHANAAFNQANASYNTANSGFIHANSAYQSQNSTGEYANAAFTVANGAFIHANSAFIDSNAAFNHANSGYNQANTATTLAQNAYDNSNTKFSSAGGTISGNVSILNDLNVLGNVNFTGNVTSITVTGNSGQFFGEAANGFNALYAGIPTGYDYQPQTVFQVSTNYDGYSQINIQNINNGPLASGDYVATADNGTEDDTYIDMGIASSTHNDPDFTLVGPNDGYLYVSGNTNTGGGDLIIGTLIENDVVFTAGGMSEENEQMRIIGSSNTINIRANVDISLSKSILLGPISNVHITGGSDDDYIRTDGAGNLIFANLTSANVIKVLYNTTNASFIQANAAFIHSNSAFDFANGVAIAANTPSHVANSASIYANGAFEQANAAVATNVTQNNSIIAAFNHANAAFEQANTGGGGGGGADQYARDHANAAFDQANTDVTNISISSGTFGNANTISVVTVEANGRISSISNTDIGGNVNFFAIGVNTPPDSANAGSIRATGDVTAFYSDGRLKDVLGTISDPINKLMQLSGVLFINNDVAESYGYKNKNIQVGVIAQEVQNVLPEAVSLAPFDTIEDKNGNQISRSGENYLTVKYEKIIPLLIESIKAQQIIIETLLKNKEE